MKSQRFSKEIQLNKDSVLLLTCPIQQWKHGTAANEGHTAPLRHPDHDEQCRRSALRKLTK